MIVNFIQNKSVNYSRIEELLENHSRKNNLWTNNGPVKALLEDKLKKLILNTFRRGVENSGFWDKREQNIKVLAVSSGTAAYQTILMYYYIHHGIKKWLTPAYTFPTANCLPIQNITVDVCDINFETFTIDVDEQKLDDCEGVLITNLFGKKVDVPEEITNSKVVIYDNSASLQTIDGFNSSELSFGSLHHTKPLGFGEGGYICINSENCEEIYEKLKEITNFGFNFDRISKPYTSNFKMSELSASGILQFIEEYDFSRRQQISNSFLSCVEIKDLYRNFDSNFLHINTLNCLPLIFDDYVEIEPFRLYGIEANKYYKPLQHENRFFSNSNLLFNRIINLPFHAGLTDFQIEVIVNFIKSEKYKNG